MGGEIGRKLDRDVEWELTGTVTVSSAQLSQS